MRLEKLLHELTELHIMGGRKHPEATPEIRRNAKTQYDSVVGSRRSLFHAAFFFRIFVTRRKIVYARGGMVKFYLASPKILCDPSTAGAARWVYNVFRLRLEPSPARAESRARC
jgi:hypothetical protein